MVEPLCSNFRINSEKFNMLINTKNFHDILSCYLTYPKFLDRLPLANSADPDQTAPRAAV